MALRSFSKRNELDETQYPNDSCKDVAITEELLAEGSNMPPGHSTNHTVEMKANSGC